MSENTWEIMKGMELGDVELQMALQCAPVITGVKVSNLLNIELSGYRQMVEILKDSDICMYTLGATCGRVNVFIYNAAKLRAFVQRDDVQRLMSELGYADMELSDILAEFREKYQKYLKSRGDSPRNNRHRKIWLVAMELLARSGFHMRWAYCLDTHRRMWRVLFGKVAEMHFVPVTGRCMRMLNQSGEHFIYLNVRKRDLSNFFQMDCI